MLFLAKYWGGGAWLPGPPPPPPFPWPMLTHVSSLADSDIEM